MICGTGHLSVMEVNQMRDPVSRNRPAFPHLIRLAQPDRFIGVFPLTRLAAMNFRPVTASVRQIPACIFIYVATAAA